MRYTRRYTVVLLVGSGSTAGAVAQEGALLEALAEPPVAQQQLHVVVAGGDPETERGLLDRLGCPEAMEGRIGIAQEIGREGVEVGLRRCGRFCACLRRCCLIAHSAASLK